MAPDIRRPAHGKLVLPSHLLGFVCLSANHGGTRLFIHLPSEFQYDCIWPITNPQLKILTILHTLVLETMFWLYFSLLEDRGSLILLFLSFIFGELKLVSFLVNKFEIKKIIASWQCLYHELFTSFYQKCLNNTTKIYHIQKNGICSYLHYFHSRTQLNFYIKQIVNTVF